MFKDAKVHTIRIQDGDCLFLPANWWHRVSSSPIETIAVSHWYIPHDISIELMCDYICEY